MIKLSFLPNVIGLLSDGIAQHLRTNHVLIFLWSVLMQSSAPNKKTIREVSNWIPEHITEWRIRRLLTAKYWSIHSIIFWFVKNIISKLPPPKDGILYVVVDGSYKQKCGTKSPLNQKGKFKNNGIWFFGIKFVLIMFCWNHFRFPVHFMIVKKKGDPNYKTENELFREMLDDLEIPSWAKLVIVCGDAGYASKINLQKIKNMSKKDVRWGYVFALPRNWNLENGQRLKDIVNHITKGSYRKTWIPSLSKKRRRNFFVFSKLTKLKWIGEVTILLSKKGYNTGPKGVKIIVTNLTDLTQRSLISIYQRRWMIEVMFKELKSGIGLGDQQVTKVETRVKNSVGLAIVAYLLLFHFGIEGKKIVPHWSIFKIQNEMRMYLIENQLEKNYEEKIRLYKQAA